MWLDLDFLDAIQIIPKKISLVHEPPDRIMYEGRPERYVKWASRYSNGVIPTVLLNKRLK